MAPSWWISDSVRKWGSNPVRLNNCYCPNRNYGSWVTNFINYFKFSLLNFIWIVDKGILVDRFDYVHNVIGLDHETILRFPSILTCRQSRLKPRHEFLKWKNAGQYDPKSTNYVSPIDLIRDTDARFAVDIAKSSVQEFNDFCKTL